jgi:hypothetical protein
LVDLVTSPKNTTGAEKRKAILNELTNTLLDLSKIVPMTTNGVPFVVDI